MESTNYDLYQKESLEPARPDFLKIICILSFIACGLWILVCALGTVVLTFDEITVDQAWTKIVESNPQFEDIQPMEFMHQVGMWCIYMVIANIFSLIGVIMMWRLEKIGFFIYAIAELSTHFFKLNVGDQGAQSYVGLIFGIIIDLAFIIMYFVNLKYMNKNNKNTYIQSGS